MVLSNISMNLSESIAARGIYRATLAVIDLDAVAYNLASIRSVMHQQVAVCAVVKADAYGHGAVPLSKELASLGVEAFGVATVEEGVELREAGILQPVLVMGTNFSGAVAAQEFDLTPVIYSPDTAVRISEAACMAKRPMTIHIKVDTGMGRLGLLSDQWRTVLEELFQNKWIHVQGLSSHFSSAESDPRFTRLQLERFEQAVQQARTLGNIQIEHLHISNSAAILNCPEAEYTMVRPGLLLYGLYPEKSLMSKISVKPAMTFKTNVLYIKSVPVGQPISYGQTFRTQRISRIATLPVGYADGYRRDFSNRGWVLVRGRKAPVVGTVTMDFTMIDVTDLPQVSEEDEVLLFGAVEGASLPVEELAETIGAIPYELPCGLGRRVPRIYCRKGKVVDI